MESQQGNQKPSTAQDVFKILGLSNRLMEKDSSCLPETFFLNKPSTDKDQDISDNDAQSNISDNDAQSNISENDTQFSSTSSITNPFTDSSPEWRPSSKNDSASEDESTACEECPVLESVSQFVAKKTQTYSVIGNPSSQTAENTVSVECPTLVSESKIGTPIARENAQPNCVIDDSASEAGSTASIVYPALLSEPKIVIQTATNKRWAKKHCCLFCNQLVIKVARHMERKHKNEIEVAQVLALPLRSKERRAAWGQLLKDGDYEHNFKTLKDGNGLLIPKYRNETTVADNLIPCPTCKGMYKKRFLSKHCLKCSSDSNDNSQRKGFHRKGRLLLPIPSHISHSFWTKVVLSMKTDSVSKTCKNDSMILKYGERAFLKRDIEEHTAGNVSSRMRELGRLMNVVKEKTNGNISSLSEALQVGNFDLLISCVKDLAQYSDEKHQFSKGSLALRLGYSLKKCALIKKLEAKKVSNREEEKDAHDFLELIQGDWCDHISSTANQSLERQRFNKPLLMPSCEEVHKLFNYVKNQESSDYSTLVQSTLCEISMFNRKRGGEVQRMTQSDYEIGLKSDQPQKDVVACLSEAEKMLVQKLSRIEIRGKYNRKVPILLTTSMKSKLKKIMDMRSELKIESRYMFCRRHGSKPYRGNDVIRSMAEAAGVKDKSLFTWTHLRKHVATLSQAMAISENEQDMLAAFLGHSIRVHREYYRLPSEILQKAKVAKILFQINSGNLSPADNLDVSAEETIPVDENTLSESEESDGEISDDCLVDQNSDKSAHTSNQTTENGKQHGDQLNTFNLPMLKDNVCVSDATSRPKSAKSVLRHNPGKNKKRSMKVKQAEPRTSRRPWSAEEDAAVMRHLGHCVVMCKVPKKEEISEVLRHEPILHSRTWQNIKYHIYNKIQRHRSKSRL